jgi:calcineurin-like phosphoesterase family protein
MKSDWIIGDPHFLHEKIIQWTRTQFSNIKEHDDFILDSINSKVKPKDKLTLAGDVFFGSNHEEANRILSQMHGEKELIVGNHDTHNKLKHIGHHFTKIVPFYDVRFGEHTVLFSHYPVHEQQLQKRYIANVHAHTHDIVMMKKKFVTTSWNVETLEHEPIYDEVLDERYICVSAEQNGLVPFSKEEIVSRIKKLL